MNNEILRVTDDGICEQCQETIKLVVQGIGKGIDIMKNIYAQVFVEIGWVPTFTLGFITMNRVLDHYNKGDKNKSEKLMRRVAKKSI